jgi:hypothetical protein
VNETSEFGRRLKFLRERDQVTITKLSQMTHYDKERLRDFEAGRAEPKDWEVVTIAEAFKVKPEYFGSTAIPEKEAPTEEEPVSDAWRAPPVEKKGTSGAVKKGGKTLDFSDFNYFKAKDEGKKVTSAVARDDEEERPLPPDLFDDSAAIPPVFEPPPPSESMRQSGGTSQRRKKDAAAAQPAAMPSRGRQPAHEVREGPRPATASPAPRSAPAAAPPAQRPAAPATPPPKPSTPRPVAAEADALHATAAHASASDARAAALETFFYVKALCDVLLERGLFTAEEFARALRRARSSG